MLQKKIITVASISAINSKQTGEVIGVNLIEKQGEKDIRYTLWLTRKAKADKLFRNSDNPPGTAATDSKPIAASRNGGHGIP